ncbi:MAG: LCP family protein [Clostridiales bacterium]|nr:LCP family protein [Clostridiales bacterium]
MDTPYDVDNILEEVKKHREENENKIKEKAGEAKSAESAAVPAESEPAEQAAAQEPAAVAPETGESGQPVQAAEPEKGELDNIIDMIQQDERAQKVKADEKSVDLLELSNWGNSKQKAKSKGKKKKWRKTKKGKIFTGVIAAMLAVIIGLGGFAVAYVNDALDSITNSEEEVNSIEKWTGMDELVESFDTIYESASVYSLRDMIKEWYYTGTPASSSHVLNILLVGEDTRDEEIAEEGTRADSAIIASLNTDTGEITLTSILRDCYAYWELTEGDESTGQFGKINGAMSTGGIDCYIRCVENLFKVNIDNYVIVNFESFENIIDALGGITIEMTQKEIDEINNHPSRYGSVTIDGSEGEVTLDGEQALAYCRIRYIDSDTARADRQKTVLLTIFEQIKESNTYNIAKTVKTFLPYVKTGYSKSELVSIATYGLSNGWLSYSTSTYTAPSNTTDDEGNTVTTCKGGTFYGMWCWKVDYPLLAQITQNNIYGKTSIVLADNRPNFATLSEY